MAIGTTAKVVMDGVFQRGETYYLWHRVITVFFSGFVSLKSGRISVSLQRQFHSKLLALSGGSKAEGGHNQMGSTTGLHKFN